MEKEQLTLFQGRKPRSDGIVVSIDKIFLTVVGVVIALIISFSLGVNKGKKIILADIGPENGLRNRPSGFISNRQDNHLSLSGGQMLGDSRGGELKNNSRDTGDSLVIGPGKDSRDEKISYQPKTFIVEGTGDNRTDKASTANSPTYTIQLATYTKENYAKQEAVRLKTKGKTPIILKKGKYIILCLGKFSNRKDADSVVKELKIRYSDCFVRKL